MKPRVVRLKANMVGKSVPSNINGAAGRYIEKELGEQGYPMSNAPGPDIPEIEMEVKSRDLDATSAHTVGRMTPEDIKSTPYRKSVVHDKLQRQYRVKTKDQVIVSDRVYDFTVPYIQEKIEQCYEAARQKIIQGDERDYISGGSYGFFERQADGPRSYQFRFTDGAMKKLESMSCSTFHKLFTLE
jgi:hypothetical protein